jgi:hypothetical protein
MFNFISTKVYGIRQRGIHLIGLQKVQDVQRQFMETEMKQVFLSTTQI